MERSAVWVVGLVLYMVGMFQYVVVPMESDFHRLTGSLGDARVTGVVLEHGWRWLHGDVSRYWDGPFFYPAPNNMAFSETHLGSLPAYAALRLVGLDRWRALQGWIAVLFTANFLSACYFLRRFRFDAWAVPIGAYLFAFSLPNAGQIDHLAVLNITFVPAVLYFLFRWIETLDTGPFVGLAASFGGLTLCYIYAAYLTACVSLVLVTMYVATNWSALMARIRSLRMRSVTSQVACLGLLVGSLTSYGDHYWQASGSFGGRSAAEVAEYIPRPISLILAPDPAVLWRVSNALAPDSPARWEHALFTGGLATGAFVVALVFAWRDDRRVWTYALTLAGCIVLFLFWTPTFSPYLWLVKRFRFLLGIRAVSRVVFIELFLFSICLTWLVSAVLRRTRRGWLRASIAAVFAVAVVLDLSVNVRGGSFVVAEGRARSQRVVDAVRGGAPRTATAFAWWPAVGEDRVSFIHVDAMIAAQELGMPTVNGYSSVWPAGFPFDVREGRESLHAWMAIARQRYGVDPAGIAILP